MFLCVGKGPNVANRDVRKSDPNKTSGKVFGIARKGGCISADASSDEHSAGAVSISARSASQSPAALRNVEDEVDAMIASDALQPAPAALKQVATHVRKLEKENHIGWECAQCIMGHTLDSMAYNGSCSEKLTNEALA